MRPILLDSSAIIALLNRRERSHAAFAAAVASIEAPLVTCEAVISESCYLLRHVDGAAETILENVVEGLFEIPFQLSREARTVRLLLQKYADRRIDFANACLICLADEFETGDILTMDKDFNVYRWGRNKPFHPLIDLT